MAKPMIFRPGFKIGAFWLKIAIVASIVFPLLMLSRIIIDEFLLYPPVEETIKVELNLGADKTIYRKYGSSLDLSNIKITFKTTANESRYVLVHEEDLVGYDKEYIGKQTINDIKFNYRRADYVAHTEFYIVITEK